VPPSPTRSKGYAREGVDRQQRREMTAGA